jgi:thiamine-monophosphate kinase
MKSEFDFLRNLKQRFSLTKIGDDCAVLPKDAETDLVITADLLVEDIDFRLRWTTPEFVGHKALAVSLSDIAAMGAKPVWAMLSLGIPEKIWKTGFVDKLYDAWFKLARRHNVELIGGDVSKTPDKIVIDSIVGGEVLKGSAVLRSGANVGDLIYVSGSLGGARAGLNYLETGIKPSSVNVNSSRYKLFLRQLKPDAQTGLGRVLGEQKIATSMIDVSDGLSGDLFHICEASEKGARIYEYKIPIDKNIVQSSSENLDILDFALNGGEDFELLFTVNPSNSEKILEEISVSEKVEITCIGEITETPESIELISQISERKLIPKGFQHFGN